MAAARRPPSPGCWNGAEPVPDVVIAGYGPAGAAAAIAAHDAGRSVLVLESAERGGGNARYSGGFLFDVPDEAAVAHLDALCFGRTDRRVLGAYAAGLHELDGWLRSLGGTTAPFDPPPARLPAPFPSWPVGHRGNTGAGLVMAQQAGAALWHMYGCFGWFAFRTPEFPAPFAVDFFAASHVFVDADGRRFADETGYEVHDRLRALLTYLPRNPNRPRLPSWAVFDEAARPARHAQRLRLEPGQLGGDRPWLDHQRSQSRRTGRADGRGSRGPHQHPGAVQRVRPGWP